MKEYKLAEVESKFADLIWSNEPIASGELVKLCVVQLDWKKSTTYTMLKRLCDRGIFENREGTVVSKIKKEEFFAIQSNEFVERTFGGSLPEFLTAFTSCKRLSKEEIRELQQLIDQYQEE